MEKDYFADAYSPPGSDVNAGIPATAQGAPLAGRGTRLAAASLDGLLIAIPLLPLLAVSAYYAVRTQMEIVRSSGGAHLDHPSAIVSPQFPGFMVAGTLVGVLGALGVVVYQWVLISRTGQSLGKKWTGIRIDRIDGLPISFGTGVALRNWVPKVMGAVPYLGALFHLVDLLCIFREDRRCLHDHIAGTRVVRHER